MPILTYRKGDDATPVNDSFTASIDCFVTYPTARRSFVWASKVQVHADTAEEANKLRDVCLRALKETE